MVSYKLREENVSERKEWSASNAANKSGKRRLKIDH